MSLDSVATPARQPRAISYVDPLEVAEGADETNKINSVRGEELSFYSTGESAKYPENVYQNIEVRVGKFSQLLPRTTRNPPFFNTTLNAELLTREIVSGKAMSDMILIPPNFEDVDKVVKKANLNIFKPDGLRYVRSNGAPLNNPPQNGQSWNLVVANTNFFANNLSNAGTNYHAT